MAPLLSRRREERNTNGVETMTNKLNRIATLLKTDDRQLVLTVAVATLIMTVSVATLVKSGYTASDALDTVLTLSASAGRNAC